MKSIRILAILLVHLLMAIQAMAQSDPAFKLEKENGHYFLNTSVNGIGAKLMLESGVPGFMMSESFYEDHKDLLNLQVVPCHERIRYLGGMHNIKYTAQARLRIGDAIFEGTIKIADGDHALMIPINMFRNAADDSGITRIDLSNNELRIISRASLPSLVKDAAAMDLSYNKFGMSVVNTQLSMDVNGLNIKLKGNFIVDMGNGSLLFLNKSQSIVESTLADSHVTLKEARDRNGKVVAEGLFADKLTICGRSFVDASVGVSRFPSLDECGFLGVKFFTTPAIFDFDKGKMYLTQVSGI